VADRSLRSPPAAILALAADDTIRVREDVWAVDIQIWDAKWAVDNQFWDAKWAFDNQINPRQVRRLGALPQLQAGS
jgi:hypothetical protein